jgi:hypothetical protein
MLTETEVLAIKPICEEAQEARGTITELARTKPSSHKR